MGHWGVKSFENDDAHDALDGAFERIHGPVYDDLMDDRNPMTPDQVFHKLANPATLADAVESLRDQFGDDFGAWDEVERLAFVGVVVRHAEAGVPVPEEFRLRAVEWLEGETIDWEEKTLRDLRRGKEVALLRRLASATREGA